MKSEFLSIDFEQIFDIISSIRTSSLVKHEKRSSQHFVTTASIEWKQVSSNVRDKFVRCNFLLLVRNFIFSLNVQSWVFQECSHFNHYYHSFHPDHILHVAEDRYFRGNHNKSFDHDDLVPKSFPAFIRAFSIYQS